MVAFTTVNSIGSKENCCVGVWRRSASCAQADASVCALALCALLVWVADCVVGALGQTQAMLPGAVTNPDIWMDGKHRPRGTLITIEVVTVVCAYAVARPTSSTAMVLDHPWLL